MKGKIIKNISNLYSVLVNDEIYDCIPRGKFRNLNITPLVGDEVIIDIENKYILEVLKRRNELNRPMISNVDAGIILTSLKGPNLSLLLLDKQISFLTINNIEPVIIFSKLDLIDDLNDINNLRKYYESIGIKVFYNNELEKIKKYLKGKEVVITGQTGAGKSTLINKLGNLNIKTSEISKALGRGRHTTRHVQIYNIDGINIADTPGFSALELNNYSKEEIRESFIEFENSDCKFKDCMHIKELNCKIKEKVNDNTILSSRYDNYIKIISEVK
ncbi:MAG: ribosome small subunit-dependent GTPase A [Bacilli bacterium]|nr:ribosome small subunit-dependent GTPase A [Bacilli bacterium]